MIFKSKKHIIKKSISRTLELFNDCQPKIYDFLYYGAIDIAPENLVVWYLFETDEDLRTAENNGLCAEIKQNTIDNLLRFGYPKKAFEKKQSVGNDNITITINAPSEEMKETFVQDFMQSFYNKTVSVSFTSKEDIDIKANGDYRLYFQ